MSKPLIIVESPAKIKTLKKFLGNKYVIESSVGHVRDLPAKSFGIDLEKDFEPSYSILPEKKKVVEKLQQASKDAPTIYLAPDPDREGEAIAWHISQLLPKKANIKRITFTSITKNAVLEALDNPRAINIDLVNAQQARRLLDRIVGYKISPILSRRIRRNITSSLSAGRVQSVALKFVVDREKEIDSFIPVEYWNIKAKLDNKKDIFQAYLLSVDGKRITKEVEGENSFQVSNEKIAKTLVKELEACDYQIESITAKEKKRNPVPPFITSTLQQEASRHYGFSSVKTMSVAQRLYEGIDLGEHGTLGLITYMRTDSVRIVPEVITELRSFIESQYGKENVPEKARIYTTKKSAQDAHEAIRPTSLEYTPESIKKYLDREQYLLYELIWKRFIASQMESAIYDTVSCDISAGSRFILRTTGSRLKFKGFLHVYEEKVDEEAQNEEDQLLPSLKEGQKLKLIELLKEQSFTKPPPRYTEALLVKELEKSGIGRPSTYATIMRKIQSRDYTTREKGRLVPTELGKVIAQMLETNFKQIMDVGFTADMEDQLELIATDKKNWKLLLKEFWDKFAPSVEQAEKEAFVPKVFTETDCPKCGEKLMKIWAKSKYFYGCSNYPTCEYTSPLEQFTLNKEDYDPKFDWDHTCPKCQKEMVIRQGRFGTFLGCSAYPECKGIINIPKKGEELPDPKKMPSCPAEGCKGKITARRSRYGKIFFSCSTFPDCDVIVNDLDELKTKYVHYPRQAYKKATTSKSGKKGGGAGFAQQELKVSKELQAVIGVETSTRGNATKLIWGYIKENNLQDPKNKRTINPDEKLAKVFGSNKPLDMFQMARVISNHLQK